MTSYSIDPRTIKYGKECWILSFRGNLSNKYEKKLLDAATKTRLQSQTKYLEQNGVIQ